MAELCRMKRDLQRKAILGNDRAFLHSLDSWKKLCSLPYPFFQVDYSYQLMKVKYQGENR